MAKRRVEEEMPDVENMVIDTTVEEVPIPIIQPKAKEVVEETPQFKTNEDTGEPVNCLRNERVIVRFVSSPTAMIHSKGHVLSGGMAENATRSFTVPLLSTGQYKNVLTNNEKAYLEKVMGLEYNALSVHKRVDNFWDDSNPKGIGRVTLYKQDNYLDLTNPIDYIKYKILLANKDKIASSLQELEDRPKATYQFVIISENAETRMNLTRMDATKRCYMEYGKVEDDKATLRVIIETLEGRPTTSTTKLDYLQSKINDYIQANPRKFLSVIQDEMLPYKVLIKKSLDAGLIGKKNDAYYLRKDNSPLCEIGEESTLNNAARYLSSVKRSDLKYWLEAQIKEEN